MTRNHPHNRGAGEGATVAALLAILLFLPSPASAASAVATRPASVHAAPSVKSKVIGLIGLNQVLAARNCRKGWCAARGDYVQSDYLRFSTPAADRSYDYNVPLALPPHGYTPGFWGYGGRRHYDQFGNYTKFGQPGYADADTGGATPVDTRPRGIFGAR